MALLATLSTGSLALLSGLRPSTVNQSAIARTLSTESTVVMSADGSGQPLAQVSNSPTQFEPGELGVEVCVSLPDWQRPSLQAQEKQLQTMSRYGEAVADETLDELTKDWWNHEVFSFTTYGLSARTDPLYLSGIWTAMDSIWSCYEGDQPDRISQGEMAELWLLHHRLVDIQWQDDQYLITVEPGNSGLQLVQFRRQEQLPNLPITLVTTAGQTVEVMSGDW